MMRYQPFRALVCGVTATMALAACAGSPSATPAPTKPAAPATAAPVATQPAAPATAAPAATQPAAPATQPAAAPTKPAAPPATQPAAAPTKPAAPPATQPAAAPTKPAANATPIAPKPAAAATPIAPAQVGLNMHGLPYKPQVKSVPATPYDASGPPGPVGMPQHVEITFTPPHKDVFEPILYVIPVLAYQQLWGNAGNPTISNTISRIYTYTYALPNPAPTSGFPALPAEATFGVNDVAVQAGRVKPEASSASKSGYRFVGRWAQDAKPITNNGLRYVYQGFTNDGKQLVSFFWPVTTNKLPATTSASEMTKFTADPDAYLKAQVQMLNALSPSDWSPNLNTLDQIVASLTINGMTPTGLIGNRWQWQGTTYQGKSTPVANPAQYQVVFTADGAVQVKADCNNAAGTYTYSGGMVGGLRVELGPTTAAACPAGSRSEELLSSLSAAQDYRVPPGGGVLQLNMPAGGPVLMFSAAP